MSQIDQLPVYLFLSVSLERSDENHDNDDTIDNTEDDVEATDDSDHLNDMRVDHSGCWQWDGGHLEHET